MTETSEPWHALGAHSTTPSTSVRDLQAHAAVPHSGVLALRYRIEGDMSRIRVAAVETAAGGRTDGLWKHTCFEAFVRNDEGTGYLELNFSPAREWAAYRFTGYRAGMTPAELRAAPEISVHQTPHSLELNVTVTLPLDCTASAHRPVRLALTAVVEEDNGRLCYWSVRHPQGKPDFHHPDGYVVQL
jgi:hypothetical protein